MTTAAEIDEMPARDATASAPARKKGGRAKAILAAIVVVGLVGYGAIRLLTAGKESTDDAQTSTDMVPIAARVGGTLLAVPVTDHQAVKKGDLLAQIDPSDYETKVKQAEAELAAAKAQAAAADAQMRIVEASSRGGLGAAKAALSGTTASVAGADANIAAAQAMVLKAQADAEKADNDLKRAQALRKDDAIPQAQVDTLTSAAAAQHAAVAQAKAQVAAAEEAKRSAQTRIAEASGRVEQSTPVDAQVAVAKANADLAGARVTAAEANLTQARLNLGYTKVVAPRDGHVSKLAVHAGQIVQPSQTLTNVLPDETFVVANFKETQIGRMRAGQTADITLDGYPGKKLHAKIESIALGTGSQFSLLPPDNASGNFVKVVQRVPVKLAWTDLPPDLKLAAGLSAEVTVHVQ